MGVRLEPRKKGKKVFGYNNQGWQWFVAFAKQHGVHIPATDGKSFALTSKECKALAVIIEENASEIEAEYFQNADPKGRIEIWKYIIERAEEWKNAGGVRVSP